jgi:outer membrane protein assembly factor BamA
VNRVILLCICAAACRSPRATPTLYPALAPTCNAARVGNVVVEGGAVSDVPQLAVLAGTLDNPERTDRIAAVSAELLRDRGFPRAAVTIARRTNCGVELVVTVAKGPKFRIGSIKFEADDGFPAKTRLRAIEDSLGTVNSIGGAYVSGRLVRALDQLRRRYQEAGWLNAEIDLPEATFDDRIGEVHLRIAVRAGQRFRIGHVRVSGGPHRTRAAVIEALGLRGGQWYDASRLREGIVRARREIDDRIEMRMQVEDDGRIDLEAVVGDGQ